MNYEAGAAVGVRHCGTARQRPQPQQQRDDCSRSRASARPVFTKTVVCVCVLLRVVGWGGSGAWQYGRFYAIYCRRLRLGLTRAPAQQIRAGVVEQTKCVVGKSGWGSAEQNAGPLVGKGSHLMCHSGFAHICGMMMAITCTAGWAINIDTCH